jgi:hypothetical protein
MYSPHIDDATSFPVQRLEHILHSICEQFRGDDALVSLLDAMVPVLFADSVLGRTWWRIRTDISSLGCIANLLGIAAGTLEQTKFQPSQRPFHSPLTLDTWADYTRRSSV